MDHRPPLTPSSATTAVGIEHVRLSYTYLDRGSLDAYGSLLHRDVQLNRPDLPEAHGRNEVLRLLAEVAGPPGTHHLYKVMGDDDGVVVTGRVTRMANIPDIDFVDVVTLSGEGLLLGIRRFYYIAPRNCGCSFR